MHHVYFIGPTGGVSQRAVPPDYEPGPGEALFPTHGEPSRDQVIAALPEAEAAYAAADREARNAPLLAELASLDALLPRAVEDTWAAMGIDPETLPEAQRRRLSRKLALRAELAR